MTLKERTQILKQLSVKTNKVFYFWGTGCYEIFDKHGNLLYNLDTYTIEELLFNGLKRYDLDNGDDKEAYKVYDKLNNKK